MGVAGGPRDSGIISEPIPLPKGCWSRFATPRSHHNHSTTPRDVEATWRKVGELLDLFSNEQCANYLKNSGYVSV